jgi:hypothetical protein
MIFGTLLLFDLVFLGLLFVDWLAGVVARWIR